MSLPAKLMELADEIGLTHERLHRTLARLVREGRAERTGERALRLIRKGRMGRG